MANQEAIKRANGVVVIAILWACTAPYFKYTGNDAEVLPSLSPLLPLGDDMPTYEMTYFVGDTEPTLDKVTKPNGLTGFIGIALGLIVIRVSLYVRRREVHNLACLALLVIAFASPFEHALKSCARAGAETSCMTLNGHGIGDLYDAADADGRQKAATAIGALSLIGMGLVAFGFEYFKDTTINLITLATAGCAIATVGLANEHASDHFYAVPFGLWVAVAIALSVRVILAYFSERKDAIGIAVFIHSVAILTCTTGAFAYTMSMGKRWAWGAVMLAIVSFVEVVHAGYWLVLWKFRKGEDLSNIVQAGVTNVLPQSSRATSTNAANVSDLTRVTPAADQVQLIKKRLNFGGSSDSAV